MVIHTAAGVNEIFYIMTHKTVTVVTGLWETKKYGWDSQTATGACYLCTENSEKGHGWGGELAFSFYDIFYKMWGFLNFYIG
jgi:hypothetical protein